MSVNVIYDIRHELALALRAQVGPRPRGEVPGRDLRLRVFCLFRCYVLLFVLFVCYLYMCVWFTCVFVEVLSYLMLLTLLMYV